MGGNREIERARRASASGWYVRIASIPVAEFWRRFPILAPARPEIGGTLQKVGAMRKNARKGDLEIEK